MAGTDRTKAYHLDELTEILQERPFEFGFYHVLRLFECLYKTHPRLGKSKRPSDDQIRLTQAPRMTFESSSLTAFESGENGKPHRLLVRLFGLMGPNGPLPLHLTKYVLERQRDFRDQTFSKFLDMFHHRMLSFFYRAWANSEPTISFDRPESDHFADFIGSLIGIGMSSLKKRDIISDRTKYYYAGRLSSQAQCSEGLQAIINDYFNLPAIIEEYVGEWMQLPQNQVTRLGKTKSTLGESIILGTNVWGRQHKFRIILGPLTQKDYERFLPAGDQFRRLVALVRNYVGDELTWELNLILKWDEVPEFRLDGFARLGWTTWLGKRPGQKNANDLTINACYHAE